MKDAIIKKIEDLQDSNRSIRANLWNNYCEIRWCFRRPDNSSWEKACALIDELYANNEAIRLLKERLAELE